MTGVDCWFCENCGSGYIVKEKRKMGTCWFCGCVLERMIDAAETEQAVRDCKPQEDDSEEEKYPEDPTFTIPPD